MAYIIDGKRIKSVQIMTEPNSYQIETPPSDVQRGKKFVAKGKIVEGTGKAFEFAKHGEEFVETIFDENGNESLGIGIKEETYANVIFISSSSNGDSISQDVYRLNDNNIIRIGVNKDTSSDIYVSHSDGYLWLHLVNVLNEHTKINYFIGKDNYL